MVPAVVLRRRRCNGGCESKTSWNPASVSLFVGADRLCNRLNSPENCASSFSSGCLLNSSSMRCCNSTFVPAIDNLRTDARSCSSVLFLELVIL